MFKIEWSATGLFAWLKKHPEIERTRALRLVIQECQAQTFDDYMRGKMFPNFQQRFLPSAFSIYGFTARTEKYQARQMKKLGAVMPYYSPRRTNYGRLALALTEKHLSVKKILRAIRQVTRSAVHMRDLLKLPVAGFNIGSLSSSHFVRTTLRLPGARVMNQGGAKTEVYREEILDLTKGGGRDQRAIVKALNARMSVTMKALFNSAPRTSFVTS
jgi:hypothetical protein